LAIIKTLVVSAYYLIYLTLEEWMKPMFVIGLLVAGILGWKSHEKGSKINWKMLLSGLVLVLYTGISIWTYSGNIKEPGDLGYGLQWLYYVGMCFTGFGLGKVLRNQRVNLIVDGGG